jgi:hypothetical protein
MRTLDFGKNKGKILADCEEQYLKWLVSHEKVLAKRNQWASRDAKYILERMAQGQIFDKVGEEWVTPPSDDCLDVEHELRGWHAIDRQIKNREKAQLVNQMREIRQRRSEDLGTRGNLNGSRAFSLLR